jgi:hypothetical protein
MKRTLGVFGLLVVLTLLSSATHAQDTTWTGWISDSHCGAKGMNARHKD